MNKELFDKILKLISVEFKEFDGLYESVMSNLSPIEKVNFEKFEPYVTNRNRKFYISGDYARLCTTDKDGSYVLTVNQLESDWKENIYHRYVANYYSQDHEGNTTDYEVKIKNENDKFYLNLLVCSWDIGLGDYAYYKNFKSRILTAEEIEEFLSYSITQQQK